MPEDNLSGEFPSFSEREGESQEHFIPRQLGIQTIIQQLGGSLGSSILEPWLFTFLAQGSSSEAYFRLPDLPQGAEPVPQSQHAAPRPSSEPAQRLPLRPVVATEEAGSRGCVACGWVRGGADTLKL